MLRNRYVKSLRTIQEMVAHASAKLKEQKKGFTSSLETKLNNDVNLFLVAHVCCAAQWLCVSLVTTVMCCYLA